MPRLWRLAACGVLLCSSAPGASARVPRAVPRGAGAESSGTAPRLALFVPSLPPPRAAACTAAAQRAARAPPARPCRARHSACAAGVHLRSKSRGGDGDGVGGADDVVLGEQDTDDELFAAPSDLERQILLEGATLEGVDAEMIILGMRADEESVDAALCALLDEDEAAVALSLQRFLCTSACAKLRAYADAYTHTYTTVDAMDGQGEYQVPLRRQDLDNLIGQEATNSLWTLPQVLEERRRDGQPNLPPVWQASASLRKYTPKARTHLGFHIDSAHCTANVCLCPPSLHTGGKLLLAVGGGVREYPREEGDVTLHVGAVAHGVTAVDAGSRYALLLFYNRPGFLFQRAGGKTIRPASPPS